MSSLDDVKHLSDEELKAQDQANKNAEALSRLIANRYARQQLAGPRIFPPLVLDGTEDLTGVEYLMADIIPAEGAGMLFGESDLGKTFILTDMGVCISANQPWFQHAVMHGTVVFIEAEGSKSFALRKQAAKRHRLDDTTHPLLNKEGLPFITIYTPLGFGPDTTPEDATGYAAHIRAEVAKHPGWPPIRFVVADTLAQNIAGNADDNEDMTAFLRTFRAFLKALSTESVFGMLVHHPGHSNKDRARGAYSLPADLDLIMQLEEADENTQHDLDLVCTRMREGPPFATISLALTAVEVLDAAGRPITDKRGKVQTSLVVDARDATPAEGTEHSPLTDLVEFVKRHPRLTTSQLTDQLHKGKSTIVKLCDEAVALKMLRVISVESGKTKQVKQLYEFAMEEAPSHAPSDVRNM